MEDHSTLIKNCPHTHTQPRDVSPLALALFVYSLFTQLDLLLISLLDKILIILSQLFQDLPIVYIETSFRPQPKAARNFRSKGSTRDQKRPELLSRLDREHILTSSAFTCFRSRSSSHPPSLRSRNAASIIRTDKLPQSHDSIDVACYTSLGEAREYCPKSIPSVAPYLYKDSWLTHSETNTIIAACIMFIVILIAWNLPVLRDLISGLKVSISPP